MILRLTRGTDPGDLETTGLALLAFLGAGYTHLSREKRGGLVTGEVVKRALRRLLARQDSAGAFDRDRPAANAIASLAFVEAYGLTGSMVLREGARKAHEYLRGARPEESRAAFWRIVALRSGETAGFPHGSSPAFPEGADDYARAGAALLRAWTPRPAAGCFDPGTSPADPARLLAVTLALFRTLGPTSAGWKTWGAALKERLVRAQDSARGPCTRGSWAAARLRERMRVAALNTLSLEVYYRYANIVGR